eukprot:TRINITY_DN3460_c0_g1_i1.p1 TRINITY_DN3460_c0_g1~~TRINITY_DN3460_c0_g1_i1.p1  ORF type:complete len:109 (-),score=4.36 TRINITY_DN3460_c0_g1_i1:934-1260(-)
MKLSHAHLPSSSKLPINVTEIPQASLVSRRNRRDTENASPNHRCHQPVSLHNKIFAIEGYEKAYKFYCWRTSGIGFTCLAAQVRQQTEREEQQKMMREICWEGKSRDN